MSTAKRSYLSLGRPTYRIASHWREVWDTCLPNNKSSVKHVVCMVCPVLSLTPLFFRFHWWRGKGKSRFRRGDYDFGDSPVLANQPW